jgi:hypothetical protein
MKSVGSLLFRSMVLLALALPATALATACLVTAGELQTATGRAFGPGVESKSVDGAPLCIYAEVAAPQRRLTLNLLEQRGKAQFESRTRLLKMGKKPIELQGVGDAAYFNGTAAGVLQGDKLITFTGIRRMESTNEHIPSQRIVALLQAALGRLPK